MHLLWYLSPMAHHLFKHFFLKNERSPSILAIVLGHYPFRKYSFSILSIIFYVIVIWLELLITYGKQQACIL